MRNLFFIQQHLQTPETTDGGIGNKDLETVLLKNGFNAILFPFQQSFTPKAKITRFYFFIKLLIILPADSILVFEWPLYARIFAKLVYFISKFRKSIKLICLISDINGLKDGNKGLLEKEKNFFKHFQYFIVHNEKMQGWLRSFHPNSEIKKIEFFDFLTTPVSVFPEKSNEITFAGNLYKSAFINELDKVPDVHFHLYGKLPNHINPPANVQYHGIEKPYNLPRNIKGSYGLVWDGNSIYGSSGIFGEYIRFISPHKLSLYILAGVPIIAHKFSATASLVEKYKIGIIVESLINLNEELNKISIKEYKEMQDGCIKLATKISSGGCLTEALKRFL